MEKIVVDDDFLPVRLAFVLGEQIGKLCESLVRRNEGIRFHGHRHPDLHLTAAAAAAPAATLTLTCAGSPLLTL